MAVPRVFVSSTYYDLKQYRSNIAAFITGLGYEPIMHERSGVAYTQSQPLEADCYHELASCDIVVCIIGNHFGSKASDSDLSITMEELKTAIRYKKKIYVFISNDVYIENRTYKLNRESGNFVSAYTDNIKIHEYIAELTEATKNHVILSFETTDQIISVLRAQFAGLFQNFLAREASMTEAKTAYDLQETVSLFRGVIEDFSEEKKSFFEKFDSTYMCNNYTATIIKQHLGLTKAGFYAQDLDALDEIFKLAGFWKIECNDNEVARYYKQYNDGVIKTTIVFGLGKKLFDENLKLIIHSNKRFVDENLFFEEKTDEISDEDLPF